MLRELLWRTTHEFLFLEICTLVNPATPQEWHRFRMESHPSINFCREVFFSLLPYYYPPELWKLEGLSWCINLWMIILDVYGNYGASIIIIILELCNSSRMIFLKRSKAWVSFFSWLHHFSCMSLFLSFLSSNDVYNWLLCIFLCECTWNDTLDMQAIFEDTFKVSEKDILLTFKKL